MKHKRKDEAARRAHPGLSRSLRRLQNKANRDLLRVNPELTYVKPRPPRTVTVRPLVDAESGMVIAPEALIARRSFHRAPDDPCPAFVEIAPEPKKFIARSPEADRSSLRHAMAWGGIWGAVLALPLGLFMGLAPPEVWLSLAGVR